MPRFFKTKVILYNISPILRLSFNLFLRAKFLQQVPAGKLLEILVSNILRTSSNKL